VPQPGTDLTVMGRLAAVVTSRGGAFISRDAGAHWEPVPFGS
jgi:hypothetical protein